MTQAAGLTRVERGDRVAWFDLRPNTADASTVREVWVEDVYQLDNLDLTDRSVVDIGANIGAFTCAALAAGAVEVHAYDPDPDCISQLRRNIEVTGGANRVSIWCEAVGAHTGLGVYAPAGDPAFASATGRMINAGDGVTVPVVPLTTVLSRVHVTPIALLKVDAEGSEFDIFAGVTPDALSIVDRIVVEFHGPMMRHIRRPHSGWKLAWGVMLSTLAEWGHVETMGRPSAGGMIHGRRYGL